MTMPKRIKLLVNEVGRGILTIDGKPVLNARAVKIESEAGKLTVATVELVNIEVEVDVFADVFAPVVDMKGP